MSAAVRASGQAEVLYVGLGAGGLLSDLEILCALQDEGLSIVSATFIDSCYSASNPIQWDALTTMASYLGPSTRVAAYESMTSFALARLRAVEPAATLLVQMDVAAISIQECAAFCALADESRVPSESALEWMAPHCHCS